MKRKQLRLIIATSIFCLFVLLLLGKFSQGPTVRAATLAHGAQLSSAREASVAKSQGLRIAEISSALVPTLEQAALGQNGLILEGLLFVTIGLIWSRRIRQRSA